MRILLLVFAIALAVALYIWIARRETPPPPPPTTSVDVHTWYIDADRGDDGNNGHSEGTAWKTLSRLLRAPLLPGDTILLRRGGIWREPLNITSSGENGAPISIGAYGEGGAPSVRGSDSYSSPGQWRYEGEGLWYIEDLRVDPGMLIRDGKLATRRTGKDELADPWDFWYDAASRRLYIRLDTNPAAVAGLIEVPVRDFVAGPLGANYLRLADLDFRHPRKMTLLIWEGDHIEVEHCTFLQAPGTHLQIGQGSNYTHVAGCQFDDWNATGQGSYGVQAIEAGSGPTDVEDCSFTATRRATGSGHTAIRSEDKAWIRMVRGCRFLGNLGNLSGDGVSLSRPNGAASTITIEDNFFQDLGGGAIALDGLDNYGGNLSVTVQRNRIEGVCRGDYLERDAIQAQGLTSGRSTLLIACNLIRGTAAGKNTHGGIALREARGVRLIHNAITGADDGIALRFGTVETFVANSVLIGNRGIGIHDEAGSATCTHNVFYDNGGGHATGVTLGADDSTTNPLLDEQLRPQRGSPCIDRGIDAGLTIDIDRKPVPSGAGPDIGPYELAPPLP